MTARGILAVALALIVPQTLLAGSLEFRSAGFFASPDGQVKLYRESWSESPHVDVDGALAVSIVGPVLQPGYVTLPAGSTKTETDAARRRLDDSGAMRGFGALASRSMSEYEGGVLVRMEYDRMPPEVKEAICRIILPVAAFEGRQVRWDGGEIVLPKEKPDAGRMIYLDDPAGKTNRFRFDLGDGRDLGLEFLSPTGRRYLADCREWNEQNYHLQASFQGKTMLLYLCLLAKDQPFPIVKTPPPPPGKAEPKLSGEGTAFSAADGLYEVVAAKSGKVRGNRNGAAFFTVEAPSVRENDRQVRLDEPMSFEVKDRQVEIVSKAAGKPYAVRQTFAMEADGWLSVSAAFEHLEAGAREARVELALPAQLFAGQTVRAAERFVELPKQPARENILLDDWAGNALDYAIPAQGQGRVALICDWKAKSYLDDCRSWGEDSFKIGMEARDGAVKYRLHFWKADSPAPAYAKGNLLRDGASFETGADGVRPFACYSWNEKMVEPGITPAFDDTTAADGKVSLRLTAEDPAGKSSPHGFAFVGAVFNRVALQRDRKYTVSAWMKTDTPGLKGVLYCGETTWSGGDWGAFPVSAEWKRYHFTFFTNDFKKTGYYLTWAGIDQGCKAGSLWIDAVQLEEGDLSDFKPAAEAEFGVQADKSDKLFEEGAPCGATLRVRNNGDASLAGEVKYVVKDYWENEVRSGSVAVSVPPRDGAAYAVDLGKLPCGYYRGWFTMPGGEMKEIIFGVYKPQPLTTLPDDWPLACHNDPAPLVRKLGFGSVRAFEVFEMSDIAPEKGRFDFSRSDRMVAEAEKCGLSIMPILGTFEWPSYRRDPPVPPYAQLKAGPSAVSPDLRMAWPTIEAWKEYVRALTSHYRGRITYWEVLNEPNLSMTAQEYAPYLQAAYEAAKEGNPDCRVVGLCGACDLSSFVGPVFKLGGTNSFDVLSVHLYDPTPPEETHGSGSDRILEELRKAMKETYGKEARVWDTEKSYSCRQLAYTQRRVNVPVECCDEPQFLVDTFKHKAEYMIRETLLDSVAGNGGRFFWFGCFDWASNFITIRYFQPYVLDHAEFDQSPGPELLAANGLARALEGMSHPYRQLSWPASLRCVVFTGQKGSVAALWDWKGTARAGINVGKARFTLQNFFGEPIPLASDESGRIAVPLEGAPKYLSFPGLDGEACCKLLEAAQAL
jgi:hypothetical protein